jgi:hypothetical protein
VHWARHLFDQLFVSEPSDAQRYVDGTLAADASASTGVTTTSGAHADTDDASQLARIVQAPRAAELASALRSTLGVGVDAGVGVPHSLADCVVWARRLAAAQFATRIDVLRERYPPHAVTLSDQQAFWRAPRRLPRALSYAPDDRDVRRWLVCVCARHGCLQMAAFVDAATRLRARVFAIDASVDARQVH